MNYEAIILDTQRGHHKRGVATTPQRAILIAWRGINELAGAPDIDPALIPKMFCTASLSDEFYSEPKAIGEQISEPRILLMFDTTKEVIYTPVGFIRPLL